MRTIPYQTIVHAVMKGCIQANCELPENTIQSIALALVNEKSPVGKTILKQYLDNATMAHKHQRPLCQDTGLAIFFVKLGAEVIIDGGILSDAINDGVRLGYEKGFLRKSVLADPLFDRKNTGDNTPAIIHIEIVPGNKLDIVFAPKGGGAENMSKTKMLTPSDGVQGVIDFVVDCVVGAGGNPCPPTVVGVGVGGSFEQCALLAKQALLRPLFTAHADPRYAKLEKTLLECINRSGNGPQGLGGTITSLEVHIEHRPCHLASLPVAVNLNCHSHRHVEISL